MGLLVKRLSFMSEMFNITSVSWLKHMFVLLYVLNNGSLASCICNILTNSYQETYNY